MIQTVALIKENEKNHGDQCLRKSCLNRCCEIMLPKLSIYQTAETIIKKPDITVRSAFTRGKPVS